MAYRTHNAGRFLAYLGCRAHDHDPGIMSRSNAEALARRFIQAWNAGRHHGVDDLAIDDLTVAYTRFPEPVHGPEAFKEMLAQTHRHFPDLTVTVETVVADGD